MSKYILSDTPSGYKTLIYKDLKEIKIHSSYNPVKEAERAVRAYSKGRASIIVVSGLGLGYHVSEIINRYPDIDIIVLEYDREVVKKVSQYNPQLLKRITLLTSVTDTAKVFEEINMNDFKGISHYIHRPSYRICKNYYDTLLTDIKQYISSKISDLLTRFEFEEKWTINIFKNLPEICGRSTVKDLFGKFKGYPGIIVSAGPSLRKNIHILNKLRDHCLIVSVDTAIKVLHRKNISPHIVMTLDSQNFSMKHFLGLNKFAPLLIADIVSCPGIIRSYAGEKTFSTTSKYYTNRKGEQIRETTPAADWLEKFMEPIGDIQSGGSVATSAFDLLLNLGCDPIILIGQDLAYTGREIHCSGTYHNDDWLTLISRLNNLNTINQNVIRKRKIKQVESFGKKNKVITDFVLDLYRTWFEDSSLKVNRTIFNATEGGAHIKNMKEETLASISEMLNKKPELTPDKIIDDSISHEDKSDTKKLIAGLENAISHIDHIDLIIKENNPADMNEISHIIESKGLSELYRPFMRKCGIYLSRHDPEPDEAVDIIKKAIARANSVLLPLLKNSLNKLT